MNSNLSQGEPSFSKIGQFIEGLLPKGKGAKSKEITKIGKVIKKRF